MMWQYLVAFYITAASGGGEWILPSAEAEPSWLPPDPDALRIGRGSSLQQGCAAIGQHGWELVGVTHSVTTYTLFFKKPA
jgi:hypothetical protein